MLNRKTSDVTLMLKPLLQYMSCGGFHGARAGAGVSRLSEPLLWLILRVLDCETMIRHCLNMGTLLSTIQLIFVFGRCDWDTKTQMEETDLFGEQSVENRFNSCDITFSKF